MLPPSESTFVEFILYNNWANQQVLQACLKLSPEQLATPIPGGYGSIHATLGHLVASEAFYLELLTGSCPTPPFQWDQRPGLPEIASYAALVGRGLVDMAGRVLPTDLIIEEADDKQFSYQARVLFIQIIDHGIEHRTNVTTILNQGLAAPPNVDGWAYAEAHPDRFDFK